MIKRGKLLGESWNKAPDVKIYSRHFFSTGIVPFKPYMLLDYVFIHNLLSNVAEGIPQGIAEELIKKSEDELEDHKN